MLLKNALLLIFAQAFKNGEAKLSLQAIQTQMASQT